MGFVTTALRGRFWDETTGSVTDAIAVGEEILTRNDCLWGSEDMGCFEDISEILAAIQLSLSSGGGGGGCCTPEGTKFEQDPGIEGGTPPAGSGEPDPGIVDRKCKVANQIWTFVRNLLQELDNNNIDDLIGVWGTLVGVLVGAILGLSTLGPLGALFGAIVGAVLGVIARLTDVSIDLAGMVTEMDAKQDEFVCALFLSTDADQARSDALQSLTLTTLQEVLLGWILRYDVLNMLYFSNDDIPEATVDAWPATVDCDLCPTDCEWQVVWGTGTILTNGSPFVITSEDKGGGVHEIQIRKTDECCPDDDTVELLSWTGSPNNGFGVYEWAACPARNRIVTRTTPLAASWSAMQVAQTESTAGVFTFTFTIVP